MVSYAGLPGRFSGLIIIEHTIGGQRIAPAYAHMWQNGIYVTAGDRVVAGQHIGDVGSAGKSTGAHLHFEIRPGWTTSATIDTEVWLADQGVEELDTVTTAALCTAGQAAWRWTSSPTSEPLSSGNISSAVRARTGVLVCIGAAALAGVDVTWVNFLLGVGAGI